jgi:hypothetical protein
MITLLTRKLSFSCVAITLLALSCRLEPEAPEDQFEVEVFSKIRRLCGAFPCAINLDPV